MMSSCGHETTFYFLPPTVTHLQENFPRLIPDSSIDRSLLRCRLCDLIATQAAADIAEAGPPSLEKEIDIETQISELKEAITEGVETDNENALPRLHQKLNAAVNATDQRILEAWNVFWAVWGFGEGPDRKNEEFGEDIEIEFPPEESKPEDSKPKEKGKPKVKTKVETLHKAHVKKSSRKSAKKGKK